VQEKKPTGIALVVANEQAKVQNLKSVGEIPIDLSNCSLTKFNLMFFNA